MKQDCDLGNAFVSKDATVQRRKQPAYTVGAASFALRCCSQQDMSSGLMLQGFLQDVLLDLQKAASMFDESFIHEFQNACAD